MSESRPATEPNLAGPPQDPTVAILPWGDVFEDWLDPLGVSFEDFCEAFTGSWMFDYARALRTAGVQTVLVCVTDRVDIPVRTIHRPSGAVLRFLPTSSGFRLLRRAMGRRPLSGTRAAGAAVRHLGPYLATPTGGLARVLREERCVAVLCQEYETPRFDVCVAVGRVLGLPTFATFQGGDYQVSRLERPIRPLTVRAAAALVVAAADERERVTARYRVPTRKLASIFNPIDLASWWPEEQAGARRALGIPRNAQVVAWHGQVQIRRKGLDVLLEAWERICDDRAGRDLHLLVVGAGADLEELRRRIHERRLRGVRVVSEWVHDRGQLRRLLCAADVYAFPSRHEGFPLAPVEAMACGLPVVACDAQGLPDIIASGQGGIVVPREDVAAFAAALGQLLDDGPRREELGRGARRRAEDAFSLESVGRDLRALMVDRRSADFRPGSARR